MVCATSKASDQPAHTRSLIRAFASRLSITVEASTMNTDQTAMIEVVFSDVRIPSKTMRIDIRISEGNFHTECAGSLLWKRGDFILNQMRGFSRYSN